MKRYFAILFITALTAGPAAAQEALIMYTKGQAQVQDVRGARRGAQVGRKVLLNETCLTGKASTLELRAGNDTITLRENTVFKLMEAQKKGQKQNAYSCALGSMNLKIKSVSGVGPRITSGSMSAGVRGTAFEVYAGVDGSSLILVTEGQVEVEAQGSTVFVDPNEGVEVKPGRAPGEKFVLRSPIDFKTWNSERFTEMMQDPIRSLESIKSEMNAFLKSIDDLYEEYKPKIDWMKTEMGKQEEMIKAKGKEAWQNYYQETIEPTGIEASYIYIDIRYNALSALSVRRFILGRLYLLMTTKYIADQSNESYREFIIRYKKIISDFSSSTRIHLVEADI